MARKSLPDRVNVLKQFSDYIAIMYASHNVQHCSPESVVSLFAHCKLGFTVMLFSCFRP